MPILLYFGDIGVSGRHVHSDDDIRVSFHVAIIVKFLRWKQTCFCYEAMISSKICYKFLLVSSANPPAERIQDVENIGLEEHGALIFLGT